MKKLLVLLGIIFILVGCNNNYESVAEYIQDIQSELDADGSIDIDVSYQETGRAIVMTINDERYRKNYDAYLLGDDEIRQAIEDSIEMYGKISEGIKDILPENDQGYQLWIRDHTGQDILKFKDGKLIDQFNNEAE